MTWASCMKYWCMYYSVKSIAINDWRLGVMYYSFVVAIFVYIIYNLLVQGSYLNQSPPVAGSVRATVLLNTTGLSIPTYCSSPPTGFSGCLYWNPEQFVYPYAGQPNIVFITTRVTITKTVTPASRGCSDFSQAASQSRCRPPAIGDASNISNKYYIAWAEFSTLQLDHAVRTELKQSFGISNFLTASTTQMSGRMLFGCSGNPNKVGGSYGSAYHNPPNSDPVLDVMSVTEVIGNATCDTNTFNLDGISNAPGTKNETWRSSGVVVSFAISYSNAGSTGIQNPSSIHYYYIPALVDRTEYKILEQQISADGSITYLNRHGIILVFQQTGSIGQFDFFALLINLVAGLALLRVATTIVEILMLYILPNRALYNQVKFEQTIDLTDQEAIFHAIPRPKPIDNNAVKDNATTENPPAGASSSPPPPKSDTRVPPPARLSTMPQSPASPSASSGHTTATSANAYPGQAAMHTVQISQPQSPPPQLSHPQQLSQPQHPLLIQQTSQQPIIYAQPQQQAPQIVYLPQQPIMTQPQQPQYYYQ